VAAAKNVVLVTGGLGDIGAAIAAKFLNKGWRVAVNDVRWKRWRRRSSAISARPLRS
jgi:NAD(P)-dependent dehydrogenase (short-subunit alcohol dehydrogenase family)